MSSQLARDLDDDWSDPRFPPRQTGDVLFLTAYSRLDVTGKDLAKVLQTSGYEVQAVGRETVNVYVPRDAAHAVARMDAVRFLDYPIRPVPLTVSEGVSAMGADDLHNVSRTGEGVDLAVIEFGFDPNHTEIADNVNETVNFTDEPFGSGDTTHGTAVSEILVDVAPDVNLQLLKTGTITQTEEAIDWAANNSDLATMSISYFLRPRNGSSSLAQAVDAAADKGLPITIASGNQADKHWAGPWSDPDGDDILNFTSDDEVLGVGLVENESVDIYLQWDEWPETAEDYDLCLQNETTNFGCVANTTQNGDDPPFEAIFGLTPPETEFWEFAVRKTDANGTSEFHLDVNPSERMCCFEHQVPERSLQVPSDAQESLGIAAVNYTSDHGLHSYSSRGPTDDGRTQPLFSASSRVTTESYDPKPFSGTSAAAPHVAGAIALMLGEDPTLTHTQVEDTLAATAEDLNVTGLDNRTGHGWVNASAAVMSVDDTPPSVALVNFTPPGPVNATDLDVNITFDDFLADPPGGNVELELSDGSTLNVTLNATDDKWWNGSVTIPADAPTGTATLNVTSMEDWAGNVRTTPDRNATIFVDATDPASDAGADQTVGVNATVTFDGTASTDDDSIDTYHWDFGDGNTTTSNSTPTHSYERLGNYTVTLTVTDRAGNTDTDTTNVTVEPGPLDHVLIEDVDGTEIENVTMTTDDTLTVFARGYDEFGHLIGDANATWATTGDLDDIPAGPTTNVTFDPTNASTSGNITANNGTLGASTDDETGTITVDPGDIDHILIEHQNGTEIGGQTLTTDDTLDLYTRGYDADDNLLGDVTANWSVTGDLDAVPTGPTTNVTFDPSTAPTSGTITADRGDITGDPDDDTGTITVEVGALDHIVVEHDNGTVVGDVDMTTDDALTVFARGYDADDNLIGDADATWATTGDLDGVASGPTTNVTFDPSTAGTSGNITADNATLAPTPDDTTGTITVAAGALDHIVIEDDNGTVVGDHAMTTDDTLTVFARGYDADDNLIGDANATWATTGDLDDVPAGPTTNVTFDPSTAPTSGTITADNGTLAASPDNETGTITVEPGALVDFDLTCPASAVVNTTFTCEAKNGLDADGNNVTIASVNWTVSDGQIHNETQGGGTFFANVTAPTDTDLGPVTVQANASDAGGNETTNATDVALEPGPLDDANLTCPASAVVNTTFTCSVQDGVDEFGNNVTLDSASWNATDANGDPVTLTEGPLSADVDAPEDVDLGPVTVEVTASDAGGNQTTNATDVALEPGPLADLNVTCPASVVVNTTFSCDARDGVDEFGNNVTLQDVTWSISDGDLGEETNESGVFSANFTSPTDTSLSPVDVTATGEDADASTAGNTTSVALDPAAPSQLAFTVQPPTQAIAGETWDAFEVGVQDEHGNLVSENQTVNVTISPGPNATGNLTGTLTKPVTDGTATFDDVVYDTAENITVVAGNASLADATSDEIEVLTGNLSYVQIEFANSPEVGNLSMTTDDTETFAARGYDDEDNFVAEIEVTWDTTGTLDPVPAGPSKQLTFDPATADTSGNVTAEHASANVTGDETGIITVAVGALVDFELDCPASVVVNRTAQCRASNGTDADGNDRSIADVSWSISDGSLGEETNESGVFFANFTAPTDTDLGPVTVDATASDGGGNATANASDVALEPDNATQLGFETQPPSTVTVDATWSTFTVGVQDEFGNLVPDNQTAFVDISAAGGPSAELSGTLNGTVSNGTVDFDDISYPVAETITVLAGNASLDNATSNSVDVQEETDGGGTGPSPGGDDGGTEDTQTEEEEEEDEPQGPTAAISVSCQGLTCVLDGSSSQAGDAQIQSYSWSLGDGTSGSGQTTTHTYAGPGTYTVTLGVTDANGLSDSTSTTIVLAEELTAEVTVSPPSPTEGDEVQIQAEITNVGDAPIEDETVEILIAGSAVHQETIDRLAVGASEVIQTTWTAEDGNHTLRVEVSGLLDSPVEETFQVSGEPGPEDGEDGEVIPGPGILAVIVAAGAGALLSRRRRR